MKYFDESSLFYSEAINLIDSDNYVDALKSIRKNIKSLENPDDVALAYLNCGFLNDKLGEYSAAINDFSKSILFESELEIINRRSKDVSFSGRSNSKYKNGDYRGAVEDKRKAKMIRSLEIEKLSDSNSLIIDYKNILLGTFNYDDLEPKYKTLIIVSKIKKSKYDLISDYKKLISNKRKQEVLLRLELLSESKYKVGDYKGAINALRRADKFY